MATVLSLGLFVLAVAKLVALAWLIRR